MTKKIQGRVSKKGNKKATPRVSKSSSPRVFSNERGTTTIHKRKPAKKKARK